MLQLLDAGLSHKRFSPPWRSPLGSQIAVFWAALLFFGFFFLTDRHLKRYKLWGGLTHATIHLLAAISIGWFALWASVTHIGPQLDAILQLLITGAIIQLAGYGAGPVIIGSTCTSR